MHALASTEQTFTRANFPKGFHFWYLNRSFSGSRRGSRRARHKSCIGARITIQRRTYSIQKHILILHQAVCCVDKQFMLFDLPENVYLFSPLCNDKVNVTASVFSLVIDGYKASSGMYYVN
ncbi:hypothetical protein YC2023_092961 [Brassica napus]